MKEFNLRITVIIVTYNSYDTIVKCLDALEASAKSGYLKVVLVDNDSTDGTVEIINQNFPWVNLIESEYNGGFAAGNNLAMPQLEGDYCFFLNPDARVGPYCCSKLVEFLDNHPDVGCAGPAVLADRDNRNTLSYHAFTSLFTSLWSAAGINRILPLNRTAGHWEIRRTPPVKAVEVDRLLGAAMMIRRKAIEDIGMFDERFFLYSEEEDVCLRLQRSGWKVYYFPKVYIIHVGAACTEHSIPISIAAANWSRYLFLRKHRLRLSAELSRLFWIPALSLRYFFAFGRGSVAAKAQKEGYRLSLKSLLKPGFFDKEIRPKYDRLPREGASD